jgi:pimeloyl-ACP methyl ester carboxylesterase
VLLYAHGTSLQKSYDMADIANNTEARLAAAVFAAQGFIVVAPNYAGYGGSSLGYHPYLDRVQEGADMLDALRAARSSFTAIGARDSGKLLVTGYSQGGYVALATQRAMQELGNAEFTLTAAAACRARTRSRFGDDLFGGAPRDGATVIVPTIINAAQHASAAIYRTPADVYEAQYAATIVDLVPGTLGSSELVSQGQAAGKRAVRGRLDAADAGLHPVLRRQQPDPQRLPRSLPGRPCRPSLRQSAAAPLNCAPAHSLRKWLVSNDLRSYAADRADHAVRRP